MKDRKITIFLIFGFVFFLLMGNKPTEGCVKNYPKIASETKMMWTLIGNKFSDPNMKWKKQTVFIKDEYESIGITNKEGNLYFFEKIHGKLESVSMTYEIGFKIDETANTVKELVEELENFFKNQGIETTSDFDYKLNVFKLGSSSGLLTGITLDRNKQFNLFWDHSTIKIDMMTLLYLDWRDKNK